MTPQEEHDAAVKEFNRCRREGNREWASIYAREILRLKKLLKQAK